MYTNARSMGNKQEELEAIVQQESYDVVAITETWWDDSHDWSAAMDGYKLFRRDRQGRRGGGVALYVRESLDSLELEVSNNKVECLWIKIRGKANKADILVGVCYRPPNQDDEDDEFFYKQLADVSKSPALVLVGDFNLLDVCWELHTAEKRQSRRFLECIEDNFLLQLVNEPTRDGALLDLLFTNREGLVGDVVVGGRLGHSDHEIIEFSILRDARRAINKTSTLDFQRADFSLFKKLVQRVIALVGYLPGVFVLCLMILPVNGWMVPQPKQNVWVTLVEMIHQETLCLSLANPENPFSTCLVGLPLDKWPCPEFQKVCNSSAPKINVDNWDPIYAYLPQIPSDRTQSCHFC
ncbi:uncharacterized protein LOC127469851 [Manacus candei]|uniref:uncharacterized protein LOC127469851 n=1 Tax=Manacus candei TaxID=415023 RepID=UPI0022266773|nr:uncharacterized protein LOC127469851 [Manacus candei]